jgi:hypothetical protein
MILGNFKFNHTHVAKKYAAPVRHLKHLKIYQSGVLAPFNAMHTVLTLNTACFYLYLPYRFLHRHAKLHIYNNQHHPVLLHSFIKLLNENEKEVETNHLLLHPNQHIRASLESKGWVISVL